MDKAGHSLETETRILKIRSDSGASNASLNPNFPLAILNISTLDNPYLSTANLAEAKTSYTITVANPVFFGIAYTNAKVTLTLTEEDCRASLAMTAGSCIKTYSTIANQDSRFGINIPKDDLKYGKKYKASMSVSYIQDYNELPEFILTIGGVSKVLGISTVKVPDKILDKVSAPTVAPTPAPAPTPQPQKKAENKKCFLFFCF